METGLGRNSQERPLVLAMARGAAIAALLITAAYLVWRITSTLHGASLWLAVVLLALEAHALLSLTFHTFDLWDIDAGPVAPEVSPSAFRVAVLIPTYNESREVLLPTVAAAVALEPAHETWVLDDGDRPWVAELATQLGATYRARSDHSHAKAGNINAVLPELDVDVVTLFDADHVASADFLTHTLPYFADPTVALVQTPQDFYNRDSFEHVKRRHGRLFGEQDLFYRALAAGRNRWNAAFWCGTNAVVRLAALRDVGGVATDSVTEDINTTLRMHCRNWRTVYHNEVLARGLAAGNIEQYLTQRQRWGTGAMQVLRKNNPAFLRGLRPGQRISYLSTLLGWFDSWRTLGYLLLPIATLATGALPVAAPLRTFLPWFFATFLAQRLALRLLARGHSTVWHATIFELIRLPANLHATLTLFGRGSRSFVVTAKGRDGELRKRLPAPRLLAVLFAAHIAGLAWYAATVVGLTFVHYPVPWVAHGAAVWLTVNLVALGTAIQRIRSPRFASERRAAVRFPVDGGAVFGGGVARIVDISLTGALLRADAGAPVVGEHTNVSFTSGDVRFYLPATVRSSSVSETDAAGAAQVGVEFDYLTATTAARLALALFRTGIAPRLVDSSLEDSTAA